MKQISSGPTCLWNTLKDPSQQVKNGTPLRLHPLLPFIPPLFHQPTIPTAPGPYTAFFFPPMHHNFPVVSRSEFVQSSV